MVHTIKHLQTVGIIMIQRLIPSPIDVDENNVFPLPAGTVSSVLLVSLDVLYAGAGPDLGSNQTMMRR